MSKVYAALGFHESRLEIALLRQLEDGERHLALRSVPLRHGLICADSGRLVCQKELSKLIQEEVGNAVYGRSVDVMIGISDNLCRTRKLRLTTESHPERQSSVLGELSSQMDPVVDMFPRKSLASSGGEAFMVSCPREDIMRYVSAVDRKGWILSSLTPLMVARYNYLIPRSPRVNKGQLLLVHACQSACDIALWSDELLLYREHLIRHDIRDGWAFACDKRVQQVEARIEADYTVVVRAPRELRSLIDERPTARRTSGEDDEDECSLARTIEGEVESLSLGYFDATLGLLAQGIRHQGSRCD